GRGSSCGRRDGVGRRRRRNVWRGLVAHGRAQLTERLLDLVVDVELGAEIAGGLAELADRLAQPRGGLRQLRRAEQDQREHQDDDELRRAEAEHAPLGYDADRGAASAAGRRASPDGALRKAASATVASAR